MRHVHRANRSFLVDTRGRRRGDETRAALSRRTSSPSATRTRMASHIRPTNSTPSLRTHPERRARPSAPRRARLGAPPRAKPHRRSTRPTSRRSCARCAAATCRSSPRRTWTSRAVFLPPVPCNHGVTQWAAGVKVCVTARYNRSLEPDEARVNPQVTLYSASVVVPGTGHLFEVRRALFSWCWVFRARAAASAVPSLRDARAVSPLQQTNGGGVGVGRRGGHSSFRVAFRDARVFRCVLFRSFGRSFGRSFVRSVPLRRGRLGAPRRRADGAVRAVAGERVPQGGRGAAERGRDAPRVGRGGRQDGQRERIPGPHRRQGE